MDNTSVKGQLLTDFFTHYPMGGALYDAEGALIEVNETLCERVWITKREDFLLNNLFKTDLLSDLQKEHLLHGSVVSGTTPVGFTIIPSTNNKGIRVGYTLLLTDVPQKEVDATRYDPEIRELEYITQKVTEAIPDTHGVTDTLLDKNKHICRLLTVLRHTDDKNDFFYLFDEMRKHKLLEFSTDFRLKNNNGEYRHYDVVGKTHAYDAEGRPNLILGCIIDNQKRVEYEESLIKAREKAEKADQLKSAFLANMTHEIRTPLNAIVGFSDLLSVEEDPELRESYVNLIKTNNELLVQLINDVLDVSKIESDMMSFTFADVYLPSVMRDVYGMMKMRMPEGVLLSMDACPEITLQTDKNRLVQILTNLLTNAIKHTSEGCIQFGCEVNSLNACFYVSDTGNGIPQDQLENIFARFVLPLYHVEE